MLNDGSKVAKVKLVPSCSANLCASFTSEENPFSHAFSLKYPHTSYHWVWILKKAKIERIDHGAASFIDFGGRRAYAVYMLKAFRQLEEARGKKRSEKVKMKGGGGGGNAFPCRYH